MGRYGRARDRRGRRLAVRALVVGLICVAGWQIYEVVHRVNKAAAGQSKATAVVEKGTEIEPAADDAGSNGAAFGMVPLEVRVDAGPKPVEDVVARGHRVDVLLERAQQSADNGRTLEERAALNQALGLMEEGAHAAQVRGKLAAMNTEVFLGKSIMPGDPYALLVPIEAGDSFQKIGRRFHISSDLVALLNPEANPRRLRLGAGIKVVQGPFNARVVRNEGRLDLYARDVYVRSYAAHFEDGMILPAGIYKVRPGGKVAINGPGGTLLRRIELTGADEQGLRTATIYASATMRAPATGGAVAGMRVDEGDMAQVYAALVQESWVRIEE